MNLTPHLFIIWVAVHFIHLGRSGVKQWIQNYFEHIVAHPWHQLSQQLARFFQTWIRIGFNHSHFYAILLDHHEIISNQFKSVFAKLQLFLYRHNTLNNLSFHHLIHIFRRYFKIIAQLLHR